MRPTIPVDINGVNGMGIEREGEIGIGGSIRTTRITIDRLRLLIMIIPSLPYQLSLQYHKASDAKEILFVTLSFRRTTR